MGACVGETSPPHLGSARRITVGGVTLLSMKRDRRATGWVGARGAAAMKEALREGAWGRPLEPGCGSVRGEDLLAWRWWSGWGVP